MRDDWSKFTSRDYREHRAFWEGRFALADGDFQLSANGEGSATASHTRPFSRAAQANLARISGGSYLGQLVVVLAALARVLAAHVRSGPVIVDAPPLNREGEAVPMVIEVRPETTIAEFLSEVKSVVSQSYQYQDFPARKILSGPRSDVSLCNPISGAALVLEIHDGLVARYAPSRLTAELVAALTDQVDAILAAFHETARRLDEIDIAAPHVVTGSSAPYPEGGTLIEQFEACAARFAGRVALEAPGRALTYRELATEAGRVARTLREDYGISPGAIVAVRTSRNAEWIIGLLGAMASGAAYLPIGPELPEARVEHILGEARPAAVWSPEGIERQQGAPQNPGLAYVLYTSGSTGQPKGVMVEHGGFLNMILDQIRVFGVEPDDRVLQLASASFDASLSEIFMALLAGATLVLIDEATIGDPRRFTQYLEDRRVSVLTCTPMHLGALDRHPLPSVRTLITAGDVAQVETTLHYARNKRVFNAYGPTEVSVCASMERVHPSDAAREAIPVGRPVANSSIWVADRFGRPLPPGMRGEIVFAGPGVARGYLGAPEFGRIYRTGDLGSWLPDGSLAFHGRLDQQIKVRGYRIEPAEVERALLLHPQVREAHVTLFGDGKAHSDLVAYVSTRETIELWPSIAEFHVYDDIVYGAMAGDERRNRSYRAAFERRLAGKTVLEIGPGPEAVLSRMCIAAGARKVYAVEISQAAAERARARLAELGLADRVHVIHGDVTKVELPEQVDYCVSEIVGSIGGSEGAALLIDHTRRWLKDPRCQIPERSITRIAGVSLDGHTLDLQFPEVAAHYVARIFEQVGAPFDLRLCLKNLPAECLITTDDVFEDLDFREPAIVEDSHQIRLRVIRAGNLDGLLVWLHLVVDSTHPEEAVDILESKASWLPVYFPLAEPVTDLRAGDEIEATVTRTASNGLNPDFLIEGQVTRSGRVLATLHYQACHVAPAFRETPFYRALFLGDGVPARSDPSAAGLRKHLAERLPSYMVPHHFEFLTRLPLNASGKVDRKSLPHPTRASSAAPVLPRDEREAAILKVWEDVLGQSPLGVEDNFFAIGGDSIRAIQIASRLGDSGIAVSAREVLEHATVAELAVRARTRIHKPEHQAVSGAYPPTATQRWFFASFPAAPGQFNQGIVLRHDGPIDPAGIRAVIERIYEHHDVLRSQFSEGNGHIAPTVDQVAIEMLDRPEATRFDLRNGPLMRVALIGGDRLLWVIHHLVVDWVSWRILVEDLSTGYDQWRQGKPILFASKTDSFVDWARDVQHYHPEPAERAYWEDIVATPQARLPHDWQSDTDLVADAATVTADMPAARLLGEANRAYHTEVPDLLLTALARTMQTMGSGGKTVVMLEGHGRETALSHLDVSRTVGWFTSIYPVVLALDGHRGAGAQIKAVKESLRAVPSKGVGYGALFAGAGLRPQISFNYLGQFDDSRAGRAWRLADDSPGELVSPMAARPSELEFLASCAEGRLHLSLTFNQRHYRRTTAEKLLERLTAEIAQLVEHCVSRDGSEVTVSDITYSGISQEEFEELFD